MKHGSFVSAVGKILDRWTRRTMKWQNKHLSGGEKPSVFCRYNE